MKRFEFHLSISPDTLLYYYRGAAQQVAARTHDGVSVRFPASLLKKFVTEAGVHGEFVLTCDDDFRNSTLEKKSSEK